MMKRVNIIALVAIIASVIAVVVATNDIKISNNNKLQTTCEKSLFPFHNIFADMHDGDQKEVSISSDGTMTIKPHGNDQKWVVMCQVDSTYCSADCNFNVPNKPSPPPVNITGTVWLASSTNGPKGSWASRITIEWTDPSGTIAPAKFPINAWIGLSVSDDKENINSTYKTMEDEIQLHEATREKGEREFLGLRTQTYVENCVN